jgi:hypothetical protein
MTDTTRIPPLFWKYAWPLLAFSIVLEVAVRTQGWFGTHPWVDIPMHFFWGANVFWICLWLFRCRPKMALLGVLAWQMVWEVGEMIGDKLIAQPDYMIDGLWPDGAKDTVMDLLGAAVLLAIFTAHKLPLPLPARK